MRKAEQKLRLFYVRFADVASRAVAHGDFVMR